MKKAIPIVSVVIVLLLPALAFSASEKELERLHKYGVRIGRAAGCEFNTTEARSSVERWLNRTFKDAAERSAMQKTYGETIKNETLAQRGAQTPDSCFDIRRVYSTYEWP